MCYSVREHNVHSIEAAAMSRDRLVTPCVFKLCEYTSAIMGALNFYLHANACGAINC